MAKNRHILCIETSTEICSVALAENGQCISEKSISEPNAHGTKLGLMIEEILRNNNLQVSNLSAVAYSHGPGSYTGLRIGLSTAKGICYGASLPLIPISTLQHLALGSPIKSNWYFAMLDARRMEVYGALIKQDGEFEIEPFPCIVDNYNWKELLAPREICFIGNGVEKSRTILSSYKNAKFVENHSISASSMCTIANQKLLDGKTADLAYEVPFYLKEAHVTTPKKTGI